jgi:hypothetical protein
MSLRRNSWRKCYEILVRWPSPSSRNVSMRWLLASSDKTSSFQKQSYVLHTPSSFRPKWPAFRLQSRVVTKFSFPLQDFRHLKAAVRWTVDKRDLTHNIMEQIFCDMLSQKTELPAVYWMNRIMFMSDLFSKLCLIWIKLFLIVTSLRTEQLSMDGSETHCEKANYFFPSLPSVWLDLKPKFFLITMHKIYFQPLLLIIAKHTVRVECCR